MKATLGERSALRARALKRAEQAVIKAALTTLLVFRKGDGEGEDLAMMALAGAFRHLNQARRKKKRSKSEDQKN